MYLINFEMVKKKNRLKLYVIVLWNVKALDPFFLKCVVK